ncbi:MAG: hypothetical protein LIO79_02060 [Rikenellaceae bacterium]|nr:hypothetical protein [Rikenellaceae bacterium]
MRTSIEEISESLGHSNIKTTKNYLASFPQEKKRENGREIDFNSIIISCIRFVDFAIFAKSLNLNTMGKKQRNVEVLNFTLEFQDVNDPMNPTVEEELVKLDNSSSTYYGKLFELRLFESNIENCLIGMMITTQNKEIPPKHKPSEKRITPIEIEPDEGLVFANIFLFNKVTGLFLYEVNRNGCFINQFKNFIYRNWNADYSSRFSIKIIPVLRESAYKRFERMNYFKNFKIEVYNPSALLSRLDSEDRGVNSTIKAQLIAAKESHSSCLTIEQSSLTKKLNPQGLNGKYIRQTVDFLLGLRFSGCRENIETIKVEGYSEDEEDSRKLKPIDFIGDSFKVNFSIEDIRIHRDLQERERIAGIIDVYNKLQPELQQIFQ